jgi:hypothetical protein
MSNYVVLCDCDGDPTPRIIAWIDDERTTRGRVRVRSNVSFSALPNRDGHMTYSIRCRACKRWVPWSDATAADVIDKLAPVRDTLEVRGIPMLDDPSLPVEPMSFEEFRRSMVKPAGEPRVPKATHYESRYVIPMSTLCHIVTKLRRDDT